MDHRLLRLTVENFRSLRKVSLPLGDLNVLVGPNGAGKTNVLEVFRFLADIIRTDLEPALQSRHGFGELVFRGGESSKAFIQIGLTATWTTHSSTSAPDDYKLRITRRRVRDSPSRLSRSETFQFKRTRGSGRRITIDGSRVTVADTSGTDQARSETSIGIRPLSSGLSTLPRLADEAGGTEVSAFANRLASFRVFDVDVSAARRAARVPRLDEFGDEFLELKEDASDLASFLLVLSRTHEESWQRLVQDATSVLPSLHNIRFDFPSGAAHEVVVMLEEIGRCERRPDGSSAIPAISVAEVKRIVRQSEGLPWASCGSPARLAVICKSPPRRYGTLCFAGES